MLDILHKVMKSIESLNQAHIANIFKFATWKSCLLLVETTFICYFKQIGNFVQFVADLRRELLPSFGMNEPAENQKSDVE